MFKTITYHTNLGTTPARVNRRSGELQINTPVFDKLTPEAKRFVLLHEEGHWVLQTRNELAADKYAFSKYVDEGHSLKAGVKALTQVLTNSPGHLVRSAEILKQAAHHQNKNSMNGNIWITEAHDNFLGIGKKAKAKKAERQEVRAVKKDARVERRLVKKDAKVEKKVDRNIRRQDRNERKNLRNDSKIAQRAVLAETGQSAGGMFAGGIGNAIGGVASVVGSVFGGGSSLPPAVPYDNQPTFSPAEYQLSGGGGGGAFQEAYQTASAPGGYDSSIPYNDLPEANSKNKNMPYIIAAVVVVLIGMAALFMRKN